MPVSGPPSCECRRSLGLNMVPNARACAQALLMHMAVPSLCMHEEQPMGPTAHGAHGAATMENWGGAMCFTSTTAHLSLHQSAQHSPGDRGGPPKVEPPSWRGPRDNGGHGKPPCASGGGRGPPQWKDPPEGCTTRYIEGGMYKKP